MQGYVFGLINHTHPATAQLFYDAIVRDGLADQLGRLVLWRAHIMGQAQASQCIAKRGSPAFDATRSHSLLRSNAERGTFILCGTRNRDGSIFSRLYRGGRAI